MKKIKPTVMVSIVITWAFIAFLILLTFSAPWAFKWYSGLFNRGDNVYVPITVAFYLCDIPGFLACFTLLKVLYGIKRDSVFRKSNVTSLKILSGCCFYAAIVFFAAGFFYFPLFVFSVAAFFASLIVGVIKDAFEKAVELKNENDLTI